MSSPPSRAQPVRWETVLPGGDWVSVLVRDSAINLLLNDESPSFTFDPLGRLHGAFYDGRNYRRSLDNRVLSKWAEPQEGRRRQRRWLVEPEAHELVDVAYRLAGQAAAASTEAPPAVRDALAALGRWDWTALQADRQRFQQIYTPVGILPPDQYLALVLQATQGCSHNACTFCTFYQGMPFRIKTPDEFRSHVAAVLDFFGPALRMRRSIFLADANALVIPMPRLLALLDVLADFPAQMGASAEGNKETRKQGDKEASSQGTDSFVPSSSFITHHSSILRPPSSSTPLRSGTSFLPPPFSLPLFAFIDAFHVERKTVADWEELRARGLRRVYIGMESGHDPLLRWLNKPGDAADVLDAVATLKAARLDVSLIIMLAVGGDRYAEGHVRDTVALLNAMPLGRGDLIYFSDFVESSDAPYAALAAAAGIRSVDVAAMRAQQAAIRASFVPGDPADHPQFPRYDIEEFVY